MRQLKSFAAAMTVLSALAVLATASSAAADPVQNPNSLLLQMNCGGTESQLYVTPAAGHAVMLVNGTQNTITFALTVNDPLSGGCECAAGPSRRGRASPARRGFGRRPRRRR